MQPLRTPIVMSIFELLKAGPGPSSSHTIGPMKAGTDFFSLITAQPPDVLRRARGVRVRLLGSLSATGEGHGTDRAVIAGLMGHRPEECPPALLTELPSLPPDERMLRTAGISLPLGLQNVEYGPVRHDFPYSNTLFIDLLDVPYPDPAAPRRGPGTEGGEDPYAAHILLSREYYSVGGGFLQWRGMAPEERGKPAHPYADMREVHQRLAETGLSLDEMLLQNESAVTGASREAVEHRLDTVLDLMKDTVRRGCSSHGPLPGSLGLLRKAAVLRERALSLRPFDRDLCLLNAYAYAAAEENAAGHTIVTAPTCGAAGVVPAVVMFMQEQLGLSVSAQRRGLLAAVLMGFIAKQNAAIAGAEVGCQGEIGVASAMAAAMLAQARGYSARVVENAAEIALEHHLGLTCDPVGGYVQIPCVERNAVGAVKAYNAALIAANERPEAHLVGYDDVLKAMAEIGRDMNCKYKETSTGGLAVCLVDC